MIHPLINNRKRLIVYWLIWLLLGLVQSVILIFSTEYRIEIAFFDGMLSSVIYGLLAMAVWFPATQLEYDRSNILMLIINHLAIAIIVILIWVYGVRFLIITAFSDNPGFDIIWEKSIYLRVGAGVFLYVMVIMSYYLMISMEDIAEKRMQEARLENTLRETELMMLRSQINPHFLFNSLNSISSLTITNPDKARDMVVKLSDFMRYALSRKEDKTVALETELNNLRLYLEIEKVRFGDKLLLSENVDKECLNVKIPNMILQPLYENAIKHGVYESSEKVSVSLFARRIRAGVSIQITNEFDPDSIPAGGTGTGLRNVERRLELYYGKRASLETEKKTNTYTASLYIPETIDTDNG